MTEIASEAELEALYDAPVPTSILKEVDHITDDYRKLIEASPFAILATSGPEGLDPRVALLFLIPGIGTTMRVNGRARLTADPELCASFAMEGKNPKCVIVIAVERAYTQCQKAIVRSKLWEPAMHVAKSELPTVGEMMERLSKGDFDGKAYDVEYPERMKRTIY
ncbi:MAG: hypothetical protein ABL931_20670 [Usitatibacteraceae bacterium]